MQAAVLRECIVNLARIKEAVTQSVGGTLDAAGLDSWQDLMRGMKAGLLLLGKARAVEIIEGITTQLKRVMQPGVHVLPPGFIDRLADAIVSLEYYMETLQAGRTDPWYMLDNAQACVRRSSSRRRPRRPRCRRSSPRPMRAPCRSRASRLARPRRTRTCRRSTPRRRRSRLRPASRVAPPLEPADPELLKLFIEEAHEELAKIQAGFPVWDQNPLERNALVTVRRSFHTLKGSGRMVGARELGEFAWSIENLLNRLLDNTLTRSAAILETLREAVRALPELVAQLATGAAVKADVHGIASRAHALAASRPAPALRSAEAVEEDGGAPAGGTTVISQTRTGVQAPPPHVAAPAAAPSALEAPAAHAASRSHARRAPQRPRTAAPAAAPAAAAPRAALADDTLRDIYARETAAHVATVRAYLARERRLPEPHALPEDVYRACHTLSGSSKMAQARHGIRLAEPIDHWLRRAFGSGVGLSSEELTLLEDCMVAMETVATHLDESTGFFVNHWQLLERIERAERSLDQRIAAAAAHAEPSAAAPEAAGAVGAAADGAEAARLRSGGRGDLHRRGDRAHRGLRARTRRTGARSRASADYRLALKRPLHTLKGGARMAGITPMGDLSHELESLVLLVDTGTLTADEALFDAIQASLDELARMREQVATGQRVVPARAVIARLQGLARPERRAASAAPVTPSRRMPSRRPAAPPHRRRRRRPRRSGQRAAAATARQRLRHLRDRRQPRCRRRRGSAPAAARARSRELRCARTDVDTALARLNAELRMASEVERSRRWRCPRRGRRAPARQRRAAAAAAGGCAAGRAAWRCGRALARRRPRSRGCARRSRTPRTDSPRRSRCRRDASRWRRGERQEMARVDADLLDQLLNISGEASIARARLEQQLGSFDFNLGELSRTVTRLKEQLRRLEIETEAQILHKHEDEGSHRSEFDPLELDRYSSIQQYSRALAETANDVASIQQLLENLARDTQNLLQQQARTITELQNGLMRTRMVPFQRHVQRLARIVRQAAADTGKRAELIVEGASGELDRQVLERMLPPFEHMLRNAVVHGIEKPEERIRRGKPDTGHILLELQREGAEVMVRLSDDGGGMNLKAIRDKALDARPDRAPARP